MPLPTFPINNQVRSVAFAAARLKGDTELACTRAAIEAQLKAYLGTLLTEDNDWHLSCQFGIWRFIVDNKDVKSRKSWFSSSSRTGDFNWDRLVSLIRKNILPQQEERAQEQVKKDRWAEEMKQVEALKAEFNNDLPFPIEHTTYSRDGRFLSFETGYPKFTIDEARILIQAIKATGLRKWKV